MSLIAITRPVSASFPECLITHLPRAPIDLANAVAQHVAYEELLRSLGADVVRAAGADDLPDAVFVEDCAVVVDEIAVITRPGARTRIPEVAGVADRLAQYRECVTIAEPGTLDGGDVMIVERGVYVGRSSRTNDAGIDQLRAALEPFEYAITPVDFGGALHLKSVCTALDDETLLLDPRRVDVTQFREREYLAVPGDEWPAANTINVNGTLVVADGYPATVALLESSGRPVRTVDISEFAKAEGGVSCKVILVAAGP